MLINPQFPYFCMVNEKALLQAFQQIKKEFQDVRTELDKINSQLKKPNGSSAEDLKSLQSELEKLNYTEEELFEIKSFKEPKAAELKVKELKTKTIKKEEENEVIEELDDSINLADSYY